MAAIAAPCPLPDPPLRSPRAIATRVVSRGLNRLYKLVQAGPATVQLGCEACRPVRGARGVRPRACPAGTGRRWRADTRGVCKSPHGARAWQGSPGRAAGARIAGVRAILCERQPTPRAALAGTRARLEQLVLRAGRAQHATMRNERERLSAIGNRLRRPDVGRARHQQECDRGRRFDVRCRTPGTRADASERFQPEGVAGIGVGDQRKGTPEEQVERSHGRMERTRPVRNG